jgi:hypothetical protein
MKVMHEDLMGIKGVYTIEYPWVGHPKREANTYL